jgi:mono/diheme cytochrome c family protein
VSTPRFFVIAIALAVAMSACGGGSDQTQPTNAPPTGPLVGDPAAGIDVYKGTCIACHGPDLGEVDGLGKPLAPNVFVAENSEAELVAFIFVGRPVNDPDNTHGVAMPPRGGNPSLTDQAIHDVAAYLKAQN